MSSGRDPARECGLACFRPKPLQCCANMAAFVAVYCPPALVSSGLVVYIASQITTLEKYYGFSSSQSGFLLSCNDIGFLLTTLFASFLARKVHIPRALSVTTAIYGVAGLICALAFFALPGRKFEEQTNNDVSRSLNGTLRASYNPFSAQMCSSVPLSNSSIAECAEGMEGKVGTPTKYTKTALAIVAIGMMLQGFAKAPRQPYLLTYIDDNVEKQKTSCYLGVIMGVGIFGPAIGFGIGAVFNNIYVTMEDVSITIYDPRWVGAWWLGFLCFGSLALVTAFPLCCFPKRMTPKRRRKKTEDEKKNTKENAKDFFRALRRILTNPLYMCQLLSSCTILFFVGGFLSFTPKYLETQFFLPPWYANMLMGGLAMFAAAIGSALGGSLVTCLKMSPYACVKFIFAISCITLVLPVAMMFVGCSTPEIIGFNTERVNNNISTLSCTSSCHCDNSDFFPVCGSDGNNYFSPCHAGCTDNGRGVFSDCRCIGNNNATATAGLCPSNCQMLWPFMGLNLIFGLLGTVVILPGIIFQIRCVSDEDKSMAVGISTFLQTLLGWMPGPVVAGKIVDLCCRAWGSSCYGKGACTLYDNDDFRFWRYMVEIIAKSVALILTFVALVLARKKTDWSTEAPEYETEIKIGEEEKLMEQKPSPLSLENGFGGDPIVKKKLQLDP